MLSQRLTIRLYRISYQFAPTVLMTLLAAVGISLLVALGYWQLKRAEQKQLMIHQHLLRGQQAPLSLAAFKARLQQPAQKASLRYHQLAVQGRYDPTHQFLLDNRFHQHQLGYEVITPLLIAGEDKGLLVNRGWIPRPQRRSQLPTISTPTGMVNMMGIIDIPSQQAILLGKPQQAPTHWPQIIQSTDRQQISTALGRRIFPFVIKLRPQANYGFVRAWSQVTTMPPARHTAYAVQWFALAAALWIIFIATNSRRLTGENNNDE